MKRLRSERGCHIVWTFPSKQFVAVVLPTRNAQADRTTRIAMVNGAQFGYAQWLKRHVCLGSSLADMTRLELLRPLQPSRVDLAKLQARTGQAKDHFRLQKGFGKEALWNVDVRFGAAGQYRTCAPVG